MRDHPVDRDVWISVCVCVCVLKKMMVRFIFFFRFWFVIFSCLGHIEFGHILSCVILADAFFGLLFYKKKVLTPLKAVDILK